MRRRRRVSPWLLTKCPWSSSINNSTVNISSPSVQWKRALNAWKSFWLPETQHHSLEITFPPEWLPLVFIYYGNVLLWKKSWSLKKIIKNSEEHVWRAPKLLIRQKKRSNSISLDWLPDCILSHLKLGLDVMKKLKGTHKNAVKEHTHICIIYIIYIYITLVTCAQMNKKSHEYTWDVKWLSLTHCQVKGKSV